MARNLQAEREAAAATALERKKEEMRVMFKTNFITIYYINNKTIAETML